MNDTALAPRTHVGETPIPSSAGWPWTVFESTITCPDCDNGITTLAVPGGRWNTFVGTWEPDEHEAPCETCRHVGQLDVMVCTRCRLPDSDEIPRTHNPVEAVCACGEDEMEAFHQVAS